MTVLTTPVSFIATADAEKARHFYETGLGLDCVSDQPFALVFNLGGGHMVVNDTGDIFTFHGGGVPGEHRPFRPRDL